jgi:rhodanese-related sulfurtransferase
MATKAPISGISASALTQFLGSERCPLILDVRRQPAFQATERLICGALRCPPEQVEQWIAPGDPVHAIVTVCVHGHEVGQDAAATLRRRGFDATHLIGGIEDWLGEGLPSLRKSKIYDGTKPTRWVTRTRPKIDRIACPWLIRRFVDPRAEFHYLPAHEVLDAARELDAIAFDIPGVDFSHEGEHCSFDAMLKRFDIQDAALRRLALIVRGADTSRLDLTPQSAGLYAVSLGLADLHADDHALLEAGMKIYDALYRWQRDLTSETHAWPPQERAR